MAKIVTRICDINQEPIDPEMFPNPVEVIEVFGERYAGDMGLKARDALKKALKPFIDKMHTPEPGEDPFGEMAHAAGRRGRGSGSKAAGSKPAARSKEALADIRRWAEENDMKVSPRGRISAEVIEAYEKAHAA